MALGGAVSVDKQTRLIGRSWWPQEVLSEADLERAIDGGPVDVLLAHDAPSSARIPGIEGDGGWPHDVIIEANAHRWKLWQVVDAVRPEQYWHGHYHVRYSDQIVLDADGPAPQVVHVEGLADDGAGWPDNAALVDTAGRIVPWPADGLRR